PRVDHGRNGETNGVARITRFVNDENATAADRRWGGAEDGRCLANRVGTEAATHDHRVKVAPQNRGDHRARYDTRRGDADHELRVVTSRHLERESPRELAEQRPLHLEHSLR